MTDEEAIDRIREEIERTGRFIMGAAVAPKIGEIQHFAGLPMRCVRIVTREEGAAQIKLTADLWPGPPAPEHYTLFEVEVAD